MIKYLQSFRFKGLTVILGVFLAISVVLWTERSGIQYQAEIKKKAYLDRDTVVTETQAVKNIESSCLVLMDSSQADSVVAWEQFERIFMDMKTGVDLADIRQSEIPDFSGYETIVVLMSDLNPLKDVVIKIGNWVEKGGRVLFALTLQKDTYVSLIEQKLGITDSDYGNVLARGVSSSKRASRDSKRGSSSRRFFQYTTTAGRKKARLSLNPSTGGGRGKGHVTGNRQGFLSHWVKRRSAC